MALKILMLPGSNHSLFGKRNPKQNGTITLAQINTQLQSLGQEPGAAAVKGQIFDFKGRQLPARAARGGVGEQGQVTPEPGWRGLIERAASDAARLSSHDGFKGEPTSSMGKSAALLRQAWQRAA